MAPRRVIGTSAKYQRKLTSAIKMSRIITMRCRRKVSNTLKASFDKNQTVLF